MIGRRPLEPGRDLLDTQDVGEKGDQLEAFLAQDLGAGKPFGVVGEELAQARLQVAPELVSPPFTIYIAYAEELRRSRRVLAFRDFVLDELSSLKRS